jgi:hypothetical protein
LRVHAPGRRRSTHPRAGLRLIARCHMLVLLLALPFIVLGAVVAFLIISIGNETRPSK